MDIIFSTVSSSLNIRKLTTVNGNACYEIETTNESEECPIRHVFTSESTTFIAIKHDDAIRIFNLKQNGVFPDDFKQHVEKIRGILYEFFFNPTIAMDAHVELWHEINDNSHSFAIIRPTIVECKKLVRLTNAKIIIRALNDDLQESCPDFHLNIDYITSFPANSTVSLYYDVRLNAYFEPPIVLCLFTGNDCVSSVKINVYDSVLTIDSNTNTLYQGARVQ